MSSPSGITVLAAGLSPALQKTLVFDHFQPGEVNRALRYYTDPSGKCINVAKVLCQGGMAAACLTVLGEENAPLLEELCALQGLPLYYSLSRGRVRTCTTIVDRRSDLCTELVVNEAETVTEAEEEAFRRRFLELLSRVEKAVVISGSRLPGFSDKIIPFMVQKIKAAGLLLIADYRGEDLKNSFQGDLIRPDYVKINEAEFRESFGSEAPLEEALAARSLEYGCGFVISRGSRSTLAAAGGEVFQVPSSAVPAVNPIGCGDAMTAGLAQGLVEGLSFRDALIKGRDFAAANVQSIHPGRILPDTDFS